MHEHHSNPIENPESWDDGTYQTGACAHEKHTSGLVTSLLAAVILLGGLASALGVMIIRLLSKLQNQQQEGQQPMSITAASDSNENLGNFVRSESPLPQIPTDATLQVEVQGISKEAGTQQMSQRDVFAAVEPSLVTVLCDSHAQSRGLGVVVSQEGYILTNASAVNQNGRIFVRLSDGTLLRAALVGTDDFTDLAMLYVQAENLQPVDFGSSQNLAAGETVYAIADASTMEVTTGVVDTTALSLSDGAEDGMFLQSSLGSDFGPVFSQWGQMVGFQVGNVARYFDAEQETGLALSSEQLCSLISQLTENGAVSGRPCLGFKTDAISKLYQQYWNLPCGLQVTAVNAGSLAERSDLRVGDILTALNGKRMEKLEDLVDLLHGSKPGDRYQAVVVRNGREISMELIVEQTP